ncbi:FAD-dependent thymidylate synthase [Priestia megaterium]|uniref:FAD-dependent thymidylate synthase n=1 Tax=Priestia megaterium TaxID=1404 RepID=UPI0039F67BF1
MNEVINVLDKGYVRLTNVMGSDLSVVNSARVSYDKESTELTEGDIRLIRFLAREGHTSPFRHATIQFEMYAPLMVARQHWKYIVGSDHTMDAWNESSRRYVTEDPAFYIPKEDEWRSAPANSKQGSGGPLVDKLEYHEMGELQHVYERHVEESIRLYEKSIELGMAPEQARLFLPAYGMYVRYYWTASLQSVAHFLNQRLAHDSQVEIQAYAKSVYELTKEHFPMSISELVKKEA